jgi:hypothetical protein
MPAFDVTANPTTLVVKPGEKKTLVITATNSLGRPVTARAFAVVTPPIGSAWIKAPPDAQRVFNQAKATQEFQFGIELPATAPAGSYTVRVDVVDIELPDDNFGQSPTIALTVPKAEVTTVVTDTGGIPWWVWVVAAVVIIGVGFGLWKVFFSSKKMPDLVKRSYAEALAALDTSRFVITRVDTLHQDTTSFVRGAVIGQSIPAGTKLEADSNALRIVVQQSYAAVPNLVGMAPLDAVKKLANDSLEFAQSFQPMPTHTPEEGKIVSTNPAAGTLVARNTPVTFVVRTFSEPCRDPRRCAVILDGVLLRSEFNKARVSGVRPPGG